MEQITFTLQFLQEKMPLVVLFTSAFIIARLLVVKDLCEYFVIYFLKKSEGHITKLFLYVILSAGLLSLFMPNMVTVLTLLPLIKTIEEDFKKFGLNDFCFTTVLMLLIIYGANIGGIGSITGSPASLLLLGALELHDVPGREQINFLNWLIWGLPLTLVFLLTAWYLLINLAIPKKVRNTVIDFSVMNNSQKLSTAQRKGITVFLFFFLFWVFNSIAGSFSETYKTAETIFALLFLGAFLYLAFYQKVNGEKTVMQLKDVFTGLPLRGIWFVAGLIVFIVFIQQTGIDKMIIAPFKSFIEGLNINKYLVFLIMTLIIIFMTEILSNTIVSIGFFSIAYLIALSLDMNPIPLMMAVALASTCAFMTPIATPANALAYGEMKGASLKLMMGYGFLLNIAGAILFTLWLNIFIPLIY